MANYSTEGPHPYDMDTTHHPRETEHHMTTTLDTHLERRDSLVRELRDAAFRLSNAAELLDAGESGEASELFQDVQDQLDAAERAMARL